ncbi:MAG: gfo/Idh/MocA family oxidoreductase, partial [Phycisphaerae bacterium]|nr:gfo/Idh/MocA family oxidoreductase [Phycisphaerae bacterium]
FIGTEGTIALSRGGWWTKPTSLKSVKLRPGELHLYASNNHGRNFIDCIKSRRQTVSPIDVAVWSDTMSHLSEIAIRTERKISWDPQKEVILGDAAAGRMLTRAIREPYRL